MSIQMNVCMWQHTQAILFVAVILYSVKVCIPANKATYSY